MTEVEQILMWLDNLEAHFKAMAEGPKSKREYTHHMNACRWIAAGIEDGEHKREWKAL